MAGDRRLRRYDIQQYIAQQYLIAAAVQLHAFRQFKCVDRCVVQLAYILKQLAAIAIN